MMRGKYAAVIALSASALVLAIGMGSVWIPPGDIVRILGYKLCDISLPETVTEISVNIMLKLRLPRALLAFLVGGALSASGAAMQSVLRNPLASSYTLGVSSGASFGASLVILMGITVPGLEAFTLPLMGVLFGLGTIILAVAVSSRLDGRMANNTIILIGMVFSLFINAVTSLLSFIFRSHMQRLNLWQMGSFSMKDWHAVAILAPIVILGIFYVTLRHRELDMMTFSEDQAQSMGVPVKRVKWLMLVASALLTGSAIAFTGIIGFIDLIAPHVARRFFGSRHKVIIPVSALRGGLFMALCDLAARTLASPFEIPVGIVTALIGGPFFAYVYFKRKKSIC
jgi:iron complex transport system permease protein